MSSKVKAGQLWGKNKEELSTQLEELKTELNQLRVQKIASGASTKTQRMPNFDLDSKPPHHAPHAQPVDSQPLEDSMTWNIQVLHADRWIFPLSSGEVRKSIARVLTVINANQRAQLRLFYKNKKYLPLDLRPKLTRELRRRLTKHEATQITARERKRQIHFPQRKYAVKV
ncbi:hypothetical protein N7492_010339 [Penicillium capsulatum]|uniref:Ribosomal protein L35 n=1 Tax=Penicillium capsulatum TaxID=69766 RepID=A0A9W9HNB2_9EURO|nr:hypothetical protein N7492_010339 [Penicillium capsulatum]